MDTGFHRVVLLVSSSQAFAQGKGIRFWNLTSATVSNFQLSPAGKNDWGANQTLNDKDKEVDHDERLRITGVDPGRYDAKVGYPRAARALFATSRSPPTRCFRSPTRT